MGYSCQEPARVKRCVADFNMLSHCILRVLALEMSHTGCNREIITQMLSHIRLVHLRFPVLSDSLLYVDSSCTALRIPCSTQVLLLPARAGGFVRTGGRYWRECYFVGDVAEIKSAFCTSDFQRCFLKSLGQGGNQICILQFWRLRQVHFALDVCIHEFTQQYFYVIVSTGGKE